MQDRFIRQRDLIPTHKIRSTPVAVVGCGAVGRQLSLLLASMGVGEITLWDDDVVDETNVTTQGYRHGDVGRPKVEALAEVLTAIDPTTIVIQRNEKFRNILSQPSEATFCCVDQMAARMEIWRSCRSAGIGFFSDARMLGETVRIFCVANPAAELDSGYPATLFADSESAGGRCTARSTIYTAANCASWMCHQYRRWLTNEPLDADLAIGMASSELTLGMGV